MVHIDYWCLNCGCQDGGVEASGCRIQVTPRTKGWRFGIFRDLGLQLFYGSLSVGD